MTVTDPLDRHDLAALKEWISAEFRVVDAQLEGMSQALTLAAHDRERKDAELNDVRVRFVPREVFEHRVNEMENRLDALDKHRNQANIVVAVGIFLSGVFGASVMKILGG